MRGHIRIGRWVPFRAQELLTPHRGFVWAARTAVVIVGYDHYARGRGGMDWKLGGVVRVAHAEGPDVSRAAAERAAGEAVWIPTSLLPRFGVKWSASDDANISATVAVDGHSIDLHCRIDAEGWLESFVFDRWHDPDGSGVWRACPCGGEVTEYRTFEGLTIPNAGTLAWFFGTEQWPEGEFFRYESTDLQPVGS